MSEAVILCVSAETSANPDTLAEKASYALSLLQTPALADKVAQVFSEVMVTHPNKRVLILNGSKTDFSLSILDTPTLVGYGKVIASTLKPNTSYLFLQGAMTDQVLQELLSETNFANMTVVVEDGTRLFIKPISYQKLRERKVALAVLNPLDVRLVCLNPTRSNGQCIDPELSLAELQKTIDLPVVDLGPRTM